MNGEIAAPGRDGVGEELGAWAGRQRALGRIGLRALASESLEDFLEEAAGIVARALSARLCRVVALDPGGWCLALKAERRDGGRISAVRGPVPAPLRGGGVVVEIRARSYVYGVLGVQVSGGRTLGHGEVGFMEEAAAIIGAAVEREHCEQRRLGEERERSLRAQRRLGFLAEASGTLVGATDYMATLTAAARLVVPALADWCFVDVAEEGGGAHRLVVVHAEPGKEDLAESFRSSYPFREEAPHASPRVLRTGRAELLPAIDDVLLSRLARGEEHLERMRRLGPRACLCVPLSGRRQTFGTMTLLSTFSGREYAEEDLALAETLARYTALALDGALASMPEMELARELVRMARGGRETVTSVPAVQTPDLTPRQLQVLRMLAGGSSAREIGTLLHLSQSTVRNHIRALLRAFCAHSQLEAIARARQAGLLGD